MKLYFKVNYKVNLGETLDWVLLEKGMPSKKYKMFLVNQDVWNVEIEIFSKTVSYHYQVVDKNGNTVRSEFSPHYLSIPESFKALAIEDVWNNKNFPENYLNNKVFYNKLYNFNPQKNVIQENCTHLFRIEAPIYNPDWCIVLIGNSTELGGWEYDKALPLFHTSYGVWELSLRIEQPQTIEYKYAIFDNKLGKIVEVETGENRMASPNSQKGILHVQNDHYFKFSAYQMYHAAGVAIPVFSIRTEQGFGVGEFSDIKKLADWASNTSLSVLQILPINDTTANYSWTDSYPYAAVSVYALHPQYISLENLEFKIPKDLVTSYNEDKLYLNSLELIDYEKMIAGKWKYLKAIFQAEHTVILNDHLFKKFIKDNEHWLIPYAAFCVLRDDNNTPNFNLWTSHSICRAEEINQFFSPKSDYYEATMLHAWVQYQLHLQLTDAIEYTHQLGISVKGDLPIGIYRHSVEAWTEPELFGMDFQAGAPPDQFTELGQNWEFPTYNWEAMKANNYQWWKNRFKALEQYFDAMRIDHILGFFRIWRMPISATQGILGYFYPAVPVSQEEFNARNIPFNYNRYCRPYINNQILTDYFGENKEFVFRFLDSNEDGTYYFKIEFDTQRKLTDYFSENPEGSIQDSLISLCANVLFLIEEVKGEQVYHPRFNVYQTASYHYLSDGEKSGIYELYNDYFFKRQDYLWKEKAMEKLPVILNSTRMLICGEDLGMVPDCVPEVMDELAIVALKVQRMPSDNISFYDPKNADYLNVVTASSHDSSTLRQWWKEDTDLTQNYYNHQLNQYGEAPKILEPELAEIIMKQHLYNDAMLAIFPLQEFLATDEQLCNPKMDNERINNPAVFPHYWRYRMHLDLENLIESHTFNDKIKGWVVDSGRS